MLVGRDRERAALECVLAEARQGRSGVLCVVGDAGMGKSALLSSAHGEATLAGMNLLRARGVQSEAHVPFAGLFELLRPALGLLDRIPPTQAAALEGALALRPAREQDRFAIGAATLSLLAAYAESTPLCVLIDDAHWLDGSSADALLFAFRRLLADPIAVVVTVRAGEPSLLDGADLPVLTLAALDRESASALLALAAADPVPVEVVDRLYRESGGNPLALLEFSRAGDHIGEIPPDVPLSVSASLANVYLRRARLLPERTQRILTLAAATETSDVGILTRAAASLGLTVADLDPAETAGLVAIADGRLEFHHPLTRSAIYSNATPAERREVHRAWAGALPDADVDRRAWHLAAAVTGPDEVAASALEQAGHRAKQRSAYDVASHAFERGASLAPDKVSQCRLSYLAADAAWLGGLADRAASLLTEARRHPPPPELDIDIEELRGHIAARQGPVEQAKAILLAAAETAAAIDPDRAVVLLAEALNAAFYAGDIATMEQVGLRIAELTIAGTKGRTEFFASMARGMADIVSGRGNQGSASIRRAVEVLEQSDDLRQDPRLLAWAAMGPIWLREGVIGRALIERALAAARNQAAVGVLPYLLSHVALDHATTDDWPAAEAAFHEAITLARETAQYTELAASLSRLAWLEAREGRCEDARAHASEALELSRRLGLGVCEVWALAALGDLELGLGHAEAAVTHLEEQQAVLTARGIRDVDVSPAPELVELYLRLGRTADAVAVVEPFLAGAQAKAQPWAQARAARCRGLLGGPEDQVEAFEAALALHAQTPDVFEAGRTHLAFGSSLRRARQRTAAREQLRAAMAIFDRLGAEPWSALARSELAATGETARRRVPSTLDELTPQELQIALRLAEGRTTRETAAALFLSPKTVEYHLRSVYRKLAIGSRTELADAMAKGRS